MEDDRPLMGCLPLFRMEKAGIDITAVATGLLDQAKKNVNAANALMDLSWIFTFKGQCDMAQSTQALALRLQQHYTLRPQGGRVGLRLLALMTPGDYLDNTPLEFLLEGSDVQLDLLFLGPGLPFPDPLPGHDLIFMAARQSDENLPILDLMEAYLARCPEPVVNRPNCIPRLARDRASALLGSSPGLAMPPTVQVDRLGLQRLASEGSEFPIIARPVGAHRGQGLARLDTAYDLEGYLLASSASEFYVSRFVDYRSPDGLFRKCRIVLIDGHPFASHLAISEHWMVNYINSGMEKSAWKRAEEADFMAQFDEGFAHRHAAALSAIHDRLQLDYVVLDCAETRGGRLLLFEVDSAAMVHANDPGDLFPYKRPQIQKVFSAFRRMLDRAAGK
jgi:glutathione synthase/RimK-type ligase-like ATP-grasp enzyme